MRPATPSSIPQGADVSERDPGRPHARRRDQHAGRADHLPPHRDEPDPPAVHDPRRGGQPRPQRRDRRLGRRLDTRLRRRHRTARACSSISRWNGTDFVDVTPTAATGASPRASSRSPFREVSSGHPQAIDFEALALVLRSDLMASWPTSHRTRRTRSATTWSGWRRLRRPAERDEAGRRAGSPRPGQGLRGLRRRSRGTTPTPPCGRAESTCNVRVGNARARATGRFVGGRARCAMTVPRRRGEDAPRHNDDPRCRRNRDRGVRASACVLGQRQRLWAGTPPHRGPALSPVPALQQNPQCRVRRAAAAAERRCCVEVDLDV